MSSNSPLSVFGISHVAVPVADLKRAAKFYTDGLGFSVKSQGEGWVDLDSPPILLRLLDATDGQRSVSLRIQAGNVTAVFQTLVHCGAEALYAPSKVPNQEEFATVRDPDGNTLTIWRPLTEDEYDHVPELPIKTTWSPEATALLKSLLLAVPALFRALARWKIVRIAEQMFPNKVIQPVDVVRAYILASAKVTRYRLREPLNKHGFNPDDFKAEFDED